jgi:hypothetical protein
MFLGIITGTFMFAAYFLMDMYVAFIDPTFYIEVFKQNEMYFIMFSFMIGIVVAVMYIWYYNKGIKRGRVVV